MKMAVIIAAGSTTDTFDGALRILTPSQAGCGPRGRFCFEGNEGGHSSQLPGRESGMTRVPMFDKAAYMREYRRKNREKIAATLREWRRKNPEKLKDYRRKNRSAGGGPGRAKD